MNDKTIKSPGLILGADGHVMGAPIGINSKHDSTMSLMNMLKDQNKKATHFASVMAAKVDGINRSFRSFVQVTHPLLENAPHDGQACDALLKAVNEFIAVLEEQLSVGSLAGAMPR